MIGDDEVLSPANVPGFFYIEIYCNMLSEVNPNDKRLTELESVALLKMLDKRQKYVREGRARDAHGLGTGIWILWKTLTLEQPDTTGYGSL